MDVTYTPPVTSKRDPAQSSVCGDRSGEWLISPYQLQVRASGGVGAKSSLIHCDDLPPSTALVLAASFHSAAERGILGTCIVQRCGFGDVESRLQIPQLIDDQKSTLCFVTYGRVLYIGGMFSFYLSGSMSNGGQDRSDSHLDGC